VSCWFSLAVQTPIDKGCKSFGQTIEHDIDTERIEIEGKELELTVLRLYLVHPSLHILSLLAPAVNELSSERKLVLGPSVAIDPDELDVDGLRTTGVDIKKVNVGSED
jgi:hypothetical protein